jgi:hypothetical protein
MRAAESFGGSLLMCPDAVREHSILKRLNAVSVQGGMLSREKPVLSDTAACFFTGTVNIINNGRNSGDLRSVRFAIYYRLFQRQAQIQR